MSSSPEERRTPGSVQLAAPGRTAPPSLVTIELWCRAGSLTAARSSLRAAALTAALTAAATIATATATATAAAATAATAATSREAIHRYRHTGRGDEQGLCGNRNSLGSAEASQQRQKRGRRP